jgi:hypothetical protein
VENQMPEKKEKSLQYHNEKEEKKKLKKEVNRLLVHGRRAWYPDFWEERSH